MTMIVTVPTQKLDRETPRLLTQALIELRKIRLAQETIVNSTIPDPEA